MHKRFTFCLLMALALLLSAMTLPAFPQDPMFTQSFFSPLYTNPASTGGGDFDLRICGLYRRQWWRILSDFESGTLAADKYFSKFNSGVGLLGTHESAGYLKRTGLYATYALNLHSQEPDRASNEEAREWFLNIGLQAGRIQKRIDYGRLVFADQINTAGVITSSVSSADLPVNNGRWEWDFAGGVFFNFKRSTLLGISAHHLNRPDESLTSTSPDTKSRLPRKLAVHLVQSFYPGDSWVVNFSTLCSWQGVDRFLRAGIEGTSDSHNGLSLGVFYGYGSGFGAVNTVSFTLAFNLFDPAKYEGVKLRTGFAYDAQSGNVYTQTAGSSEIGLIWDHDTGTSGDAFKPKINPYLCPDWRKKEYY